MAIWQYEPAAPQGLYKTARLLAAEPPRFYEAGVVAFRAREFEFCPPDTWCTARSRCWPMWQRAV